MKGGAVATCGIFLPFLSFPALGYPPVASPPPPS